MSLKSCCSTFGRCCLVGKYFDYRFPPVAPVVFIEARIEFFDRRSLAIIVLAMSRRTTNDPLPAPFTTRTPPPRAFVSKSTQETRILKLEPTPPPVPEPLKEDIVGTKEPEENISSYCCPICFVPPTNAVLTPCGHILCGSCLFAAVRAAQVGRQMHMPGLGRGIEAHCPVCRTEMPGFDGRGGGVIGLQPMKLGSDSKV